LRLPYLCYRGKLQAEKFSLLPFLRLRGGENASLANAVYP